MKPGEMKIFDVLMRTENGLSFTELKTETTLSAPVLSEYLKQLVADGFAIKDVKDRKYKLKKIFQPWEKLSDRERAMRFLASSAPTFAMKIRNVEAEATRVELIEKFMKLYLMHGGSVFVFNVIIHALNEWNSKGNRDLELLLPVLKEQTENWIVPYVQKLALAVALFNVEDLRKTEDAMNELFDYWLKQIEETRDFLREHRKLLDI